MTVVIAFVAGSDAYHEVVRGDDGHKVFRTYVRDRRMDRPATEAQLEEFCETARLCGGYVRRGAGMGRSRS